VIRRSGEVEYLYAEDAALIENAETESLGTTSLLESVVSASRGARSVDAVFRLIGDRFVFRLLRDVLLMVLGFALVVVIALIVSSRRERSRAIAREDAGHGPSSAEANAAAAPEHDPQGDSPGTVDAESSDDDYAEPEEVPPAAAEPEEPAQPLEPPAAEVEPVPEAAAGEADAGEAAAGEVPVPEARGELFSPRTGLSYREHLDHRLEQEIERAAFNEEDVTIALLSFPGLMATDEEYRQVAADLLKTFRFAELVFEFTDDSFCVILPNTNLDDGIKRILGFLKKYPELASHGGLSSRNGRLVEASRLLIEAERSRRKAEAEGTLVMGFRSDPELFRSYLSQTDE
jgi:GGDEF domain-containing protein